MDGPKESRAPRKRALVVGVLTLVLFGTALALVSTSSGGTADRQAPSRTQIRSGSTGHNFELLTFSQADWRSFVFSPANFS